MMVLGVGFGFQEALGLVRVWGLGFRGVRVEGLRMTQQASTDHMVPCRKREFPPQSSVGN